MALQHSEYGYPSFMRIVVYSELFNNTMLRNIFYVLEEYILYRYFI
jgi:hypothetical protein